MAGSDVLSSRTSMLFLAELDAAFGEIIRGHLDGDFIAR
jgi:hypothetical protein